MAVRGAQEIISGRGLEKIIDSSAAADARLPGGASAPLTAASQTLRPALNEALFNPALHEELASFFTPEPADPSVLAPGRYRALLREVVARLESAAAWRLERGERAASRLLTRSARITASMARAHDELTRRRAARLAG